jgi:hypothetical protein
MRLNVFKPYFRGSLVRESLSDMLSFKEDVMFLPFKPLYIWFVLLLLNIIIVWDIRFKFIISFFQIWN